MSDILFGTDGADAEDQAAPPSPPSEPTAASASNAGSRDASRDDLTRLLGQVVSLLGQSPAHRHLFVGDLEWLVLPALLNRQARIWRRETERGVVPVVYASWAMVNAEVEARLVQGQNRLKPTEWRSGDIPWLIDLVSPYGGGENALKELADQVFPGRLLKAMVPAPTGGFAVREIRGSEAKSQESVPEPKE